MIAAASTNSNAITPALIGVIGTVVGGMLAASVSIWNMRSTRKRDLEMEKVRQVQADISRRRSERREVYAEWLSGFGHLLDAMTRGQGAELGQSVMALTHVGDAIQLIASASVAEAVRNELKTLRRLATRITDREEILAQAVQLHESTLVLMRSDIE